MNKIILTEKELDQTIAALEERLRQIKWEKDERLGILNLKNKDFLKELLEIHEKTENALKKLKEGLR